MCLNFIFLIPKKLLILIFYCPISDGFDFNQVLIYPKPIGYYATDF